MVQINEHGKPESGWKTFLKKIEPQWWILLIIVTLFVGIFRYQTYPVPNLQYINSSDPFAKPQVFDVGAQIPNGYSQVLIYTAQDLDVPSGGLSSAELMAFWSIIVIFILVVAFKEKDRLLITMEEARESITNQWQYLINYKDLKNPKLKLYNPTHLGEMTWQGHLRFMEVNGKRVPYEWIIPGAIIEENGKIHHYVFGVDPYTKYLLMAVESNRPFRRQDVCPDCGQYSDSKMMETEDIKRFKDLFQIVRRGN